MIAFLDVTWRPDAVTGPARLPSQSPVNNYEGSITMTITGENARPLPLIGPILATVDRGDLDTTIRTLEQITRLAREATTTEGNR
jgi:hypothetical protein